MLWKGQKRMRWQRGIIASVVWEVLSEEVTFDGGLNDEKEAPIWRYGERYFEMGNSKEKRLEDVSYAQETGKNPTWIISLHKSG